MGISKNQIRTITALQFKKQRYEEKLFIAEGEKVVNDLLQSEWKVRSVFGTEDFFNQPNPVIASQKNIEVHIVSEDELKKISCLTTPQHVLAIAEMPESDKQINFESGLKLVFDTIKDPGNLGTLIRIADWFGIPDIICSNNSVDCFNPKVVQGSMGSLFRMEIKYEELTGVFTKNLANKKLPVYGTVLNGKSLYDEKLSANAFILVGNESTGIDTELMKFITNGITIPSYDKSKADSLNVAVATGIVCSEFRKM